MATDVHKSGAWALEKLFRDKDFLLINRLRSISEDAKFVGEFSDLWPDLPVVANLRCGLWYHREFNDSCYFKSTDGHVNKWQFSRQRLNMNVACHAARYGGCVIVDSTRRGKRFPDSFLKTVPIWACVINRAVAKLRKEGKMDTLKQEGKESRMGSSSGKRQISWLSNIPTPVENNCGWDEQLHVHPSVPMQEKVQIEERLDGWVEELLRDDCGLERNLASLDKPLRPLWYSPQSIMWTNAPIFPDSLTFTPIICLSASSSSSIHVRHTGNLMWEYIQGAGDDEEAWAHGLLPDVYYEHEDEILACSSGKACREVVTSIVKGSANNTAKLDKAPDSIWVIGSTGLLLGLYGCTRRPDILEQCDCVIGCGGPRLESLDTLGENYLYIPMSSTDRKQKRSLEQVFGPAVDFAGHHLRHGRRVLIQGVLDIKSIVAVCTVVLCSQFDSNEKITSPDAPREEMSKVRIRQALYSVVSFCPDARVDKRTRNQVHRYLMSH